MGHKRPIHGVRTMSAMSPIATEAGTSLDG